ncbi:DUF1177 domain-containing protein [Collinsella sp. AGMB00827]|uniref:DUF1177 domain-containing protein n=1 Tax=Collinsella ureilytica TaxID=2869515 RepID=A0ABS7MJZ9_9ACTN|nr:DUF1177 domain-containing protein [Collinsella urealyticum]MBY4797689.1 DUF1177 domain-containing protein [Collinsella urealyticum]
MLLRQLLEIYDLIDTPHATGDAVADLIRSRGASDVVVRSVGNGRGSTDCIKICIPGANGRISGGDAPTLGVIGRLGGLGARPEMIGAVSDGDGAIAALTCALKLAEMHKQGDVLPGDVIVATHICPDAPTLPHDPVPFMDSPIDMDAMNRMEVDPRMEAILSIDTTKGNRIINQNGIAISPTVRQGWILPVAPDLLDIQTRVTGKMPAVFALSQQDITPYGNNLYHLNSILQPATATTAPVVGVAITTEQMVAGCATGASHAQDVELAARFALEVTKVFGSRSCAFFDEEDFSRLTDLYGSMKHLQTKGTSGQQAN